MLCILRCLEKKSTLAATARRLEKKYWFTPVDECRQPFELMVSADEWAFVIDECKCVTQLVRKNRSYF